MGKKMMFTLLAAAILGLTAFTAQAVAGPVSDFGFEDITHWVGEGENQAAFLVDWNDDKLSGSIAWGYRWDGEATGADMMAAIAGQGTSTGGPYGTISGADSRMYISIQWWEGYNGYTLYGLGYDVDNDGFSYVPGAGEGGIAGDPDDLYIEGWYSGYWSYWVSDGGADWGYSGWGMSARNLENGSWDGWSFTSNAQMGGGEPPRAPAGASPVPVPSAFWLLGSGLAGILGLRRRTMAS